MVHGVTLRDEIAALARKHREKETLARAQHDKLYAEGAYVASNPHRAIAGWHAGFAYELEHLLSAEES